MSQRRSQLSDLGPDDSVSQILVSEQEDEEDEEIYKDYPSTHESASFSATADPSALRSAKRRRKNQVSAGGLFRVQMNNLEEAAHFLKVNICSI